MTSRKGEPTEQRDTVTEFADIIERRTGKRPSPEEAREWMNRLCEYFLLLNKIDLEIKARAENEKVGSASGSSPSSTT